MEFIADKSENCNKVKNHITYVCVACGCPCYLTEHYNPQGGMPRTEPPVVCQRDLSNCKWEEI